MSKKIDSGAIVAFGFNTPFFEQLEFFRQKLNLPTARWDDIIGAAHDRAFMVAGAIKADLLDDLQQTVFSRLADGRGLEAFRKDFRTIVQKHGWHGWTGEGTKAGEAWRTKVIYQTNMATSYAAGRYRQLTDPDLLTLRPYWRYVHSDNVANPRLQHVAWNGLTLPYDHAFWRTHFAPNGWGCHCRIIPVDAREYAKSQAAGQTEPPEGWDVRDGHGNLPGVAKGFDYAPGANRAGLDQMLLDPKLNRLFGSVKPSAIAHGAKPDAIEQVLRDFLPDFGEKLPPFKSLTEKIGGFKMATDALGNYYTNAAKPIYADNLRQALLNIRHGAVLSGDQEGMLKTLWHEINHNRQSGLAVSMPARGTTNHALLEAVNEFSALRTYPQFLRSIGGGEAKHIAAVRDASGYRVEVERLETVMRAIGLEPEAQLGGVEQVSHNSPIDEGKGKNLLHGLSTYLAQAGRDGGYKGLRAASVARALDAIKTVNGNEFVNAVRALRR